MLAVCRKTRLIYLLCLALTVVVALNACGTLGSSQRLVVYVSEVTETLTYTLSTQTPGDQMR